MPADNIPPFRHAPIRYAIVWLLNQFMHGLVLLPLRWQLGLCMAGGSLVRILARRRARIVDTNLKLCFPELDADARKRLTREHFRALGAGFAEMAMSWYGSVDKILSIVEIEGREHLEAAIARGRGTILYSGHFTSFSIFFPALTRLCPRLCSMYKPQRNQLMNKYMSDGRSRSFARLLSKETPRAMLKELRANSVVWYASDQSYVQKGAALIPFFGEPAMTNTAISRIARMSGAVVLPYFPRRLHGPGGPRYRLTIEPPLDDFPTDDEVADTQRLVESMESFIRQAPDQYWWVHQRFKGRQSLPDVYGAEVSES
jgi:KDO2-lipid IV(A) lauroyltransferase